MIPKIFDWDFLFVPIAWHDEGYSDRMRVLRVFGIRLVIWVK